MKAVTIFTLFIILISVACISAQKLHRKSLFFGGLVGGAQISNSNPRSEGTVALSFGGSFGIPITTNLFIYTRASYSSKSNFQSFYNTAYLTSQFQLSDQFAEANSSFSQLLLNGGLLYNFYLSDEFTIGVNGGVTFSILNQEAVLIGGQVISSVNNEAIWGYFGGIILEKGLEDSNASIFAEAQYNYAVSDAPYRASALNAMNFAFGARYYLSGSRF